MTKSLTLHSSWPSAILQPVLRYWQKGQSCDQAHSQDAFARPTCSTLEFLAYFLDSSARTNTASDRDVHSFPTASGSLARSSGTGTREINNFGRKCLPVPPCNSAWKVNSHPGISLRPSSGSSEPLNLQRKARIRRVHIVIGSVHSLHLERTPGRWAEAWQTRRLWITYQGRGFLEGWGNLALVGRSTLMILPSSYLVWNIRRIENSSSVVSLPGHLQPLKPRRSTAQHAVLLY